MSASAFIYNLTESMVHVHPYKVKLFCLSMYLAPLLASAVYIGDVTGHTLENGVHSVICRKGGATELCNWPVALIDPHEAPPLQLNTTS